MSALADGSSVDGCDRPPPSRGYLPTLPKARLALAKKRISKLTANDLLFLNEYMVNGRNATQAYRKIHPHTTYKSANVRASWVLNKPTVQAELSRRLRFDAGITRALVDQGLLQAYQWATNAQDAGLVASISMDMAKLAGYLIEKREVKTIDAGEHSTIRDLVQQALRPATSCLPDTKSSVDPHNS